MTKTNLKRFGFVPIPALVLIIAVLRFAVKPSVFYDPPWLISITNTLFIAVICIAVAGIALRNYRSSGKIQILLLGCGVLIFGIGGVIAGFVRGLPDGANLNVTIYNTGALAGALFHFLAALILMAGISPEVGSRQKDVWLAAGYLGVICFMTILTAACFQGAVPPFFIQGVGPTPVRQGILGAADILFVFSFLVFLATYGRNREDFLYWYSLALAFTSISLTAFFIQRSVGSPVGWAGRLSQYFGGIYFLVALVTAIRNAGARKTSFDNIITASLTPAEERFRALAENSPDVIERFDKDLKHVYINPAGLRLHGKPASSIVGKAIGDTGLPECYCLLWKERIGKVFETGEPLEVEGYFPAANGAVFHQSRCVPEYGADGTVADVLVISRDMTDRKRTEEALRESEAKYRNLFANMTEEVHFWRLVHDEDGEIRTWKLVDANPPALKTWGRTLEDIRGKTTDEIFGRGATGHYMPVVRKIMTEGVPHIFEDYFPAFDKYFRFTSIPLGDHFITTGADITTIRKSQRLAEQQKTRIEAVNRILHSGFTGATDEELGETCLAVALEITGSRFGFVGEIGPDGLFHGIAISETGWELCAMNDRTRHQSPPGDFLIHGIYGRVLLDGKGFFTNDPASHPDSIGTPEGHPSLSSFLGVPLLRDGRTIGMIAVGNRDGGYGGEQQESLEILAPAVVEAFVRKRAENRILQLNRELRRAHDELEKRVTERTMELAQTVEALQAEITERRKLEQQLLQSQKMESIGILAGGVAHDFNNMLNAIYGYGEIIRENIGRDNELLRDSIEQVLKAAARAAELTRGLLAFSRKQIINPKPVFIDDIIANTGKLIQRVVGEDIEFVTEFDGKGLLIMADPGQMEQVLMNLATNARDAMPNGGRLSISTRRVEVNEGSETLHDLPSPGKYALISVVDTGTGIDNESLEKLFDPFFTTKEVGKGTGLGLSIVYGIVKQHNGSVLVISKPGEGTTVNIRLPLIDGHAAPEEEKTAAKLAGGTETLLLAEDEEIVRDLLKTILERTGYKVILAGDGEEAVAKFREHDDISIVLSDVVMPGKNGKQILEEIRSLKPDIRVIFISGYTADIMHKKGLQEDGIEFITKPVKKNDLLRKIREVLDRV